MTKENSSVIGRTLTRLFLCAAAVISTVQIGRPQGILGSNLIVNGNAEAGLAGTPSTVAASIPGWTVVSGKPNVLAYGQTGGYYPSLADPAPADHGFQFFGTNLDSGTGIGTVITQPIDVSSVASIVSGDVKYAATAYLGGAGGNETVVIEFQNSNGQTFSSVQLGPAGFVGSGLSLQEQIGLVPSGTVRVTVTMTLRQC